MSALPLEPHTEAEKATLARLEAAEPAPESDDQAIWEALCNLLPCHPEGDCGWECECSAGEIRLAMKRLIVAERIHHADCEGWECCSTAERRARIVNHAAAIAAPVAQAGEGH